MMVQGRTTALFLIALLLALYMTACAGVPAATSSFKDGVYRAEAEGFHGSLAISVTIQKGLIKGIEVLSHGDTPALADPVFDEYIRRALAAQTPDVDAVGGATYSENAIREALKTALVKASL